MMNMNKKIKRNKLDYDKPDMIHDIDNVNDYTA